MTDFLRPQQLSDAEQAAERLTSDESTVRVGPMPSAPLASLPAEGAVESAQGNDETVHDESKSPASPEEARTSLHDPMPPATMPNRPFERVPVPRASVKNEEKKEAELKKKKKPLTIFTRFYVPTFLFLICGVIAVGYMLLDPIIHSLKNTNQLIGAHQQEATDVNAYLDSIKRSISAAQSIPPDVLKKVDLAIPRDVDQPRLLATMEAFGLRTGISLDSVQFSADSASQSSSAPSAIPTQGITTLRVNPINISLNVTSPSYAEARAYLESIEQSIPILDVSRISVSGDAVTGEFTYQIEMKTYSIVKAENTPIRTAMTPPPPQAPSAAAASNTGNE